MVYGNSLLINPLPRDGSENHDHDHHHHHHHHHHDQDDDAQSVREVGRGRQEDVMQARMETVTCFDNGHIVIMMRMIMNLSIMIIIAGLITDSSS